MSKGILSFLFFCGLQSTSIFSQVDFKVVGYLPHYRFDLADRIDFSKITHLNLAFANPNIEGDLDIGGKDIGDIVQQAHEQQVQVFISLAGGRLLEEWAEAWQHLMQEQNRSAFISKIIRFVRSKELDGVDMDLEWEHVNHLYSPFVLELKDSLDIYDLPITAALPGTFRYPDITSEALQAFDWINMMVYDQTGPWSPDNPGQHSSFDFARKAITYWQQQGAHSEKLTLGVPFYGYDFSNRNEINAFAFASMVQQNPNNAFLDEIGSSYYNGIPTIKAKTALALEEVSGLMIWELGQDSFDEYSLLRSIDEVIHATTHHFESKWPSAHIYPNPCSDNIHIELPDHVPHHISISDLSGKQLIAERSAAPTFSLDVGSLVSGLYILTISNATGSFSMKLAK